MTNNTAHSPYTPRKTRYDTKKSQSTSKS